jgi:hypothetical protein
MNSSGTLPAPPPTCPDCDRCRRTMAPSGWIPKPNGHGGLRRLTVFRCAGCDRLLDELWGYREDPGRP